MIWEFFGTCKDQQTRLNSVGSNRQLHTDDADGIGASPLGARALVTAVEDLV